MPDWESLVRDSGPTVYRTAWKILRNAEDAEDVLQDVLLELFQMLQRRPVDQYDGLVRRMAALRSLDRLRQRRRVLSLGEDVAEVSREDPEALAIQNELAEWLRAAVARLPEQAAAVFCLRYFENLSNREIAVALGVSQSAVSTALNKARNRLETMLNESFMGEKR